MDTNSNNTIDNKKTEDEIREDAKNKALEKIKQGAVIVNIDEIAEAEAHKAADAYMTEDKGKSNFLKRFWKHSFIEGYFRAKEINKVREEIKNTGNIYTGRIKDDNKVAHENTMQAITDRFASDYEDTLSSDEEKKILDDKDPESLRIKNEIKNLISEYAQSHLDDEAFQNEKTRILDSLTKKDKFNSSVRYADNLFELAKNARIAVEHGAKMEELDLDTNIILGKAKSSLKTEAHFNNVDKIVDYLKKTKVGQFISPAALATTVGLAYSLSVGLGVKVLRSKAAAFGTFGAAVAVSSAFAGMNESQRLAAERAQHAIEMAEGGEFEEGSKRREQMEKFQYNMVSSKDLSSNLRDLIYQKDENGKDVLKDIKPEDLENIFASIANIDARRELNKDKKIDLISYSNLGNVEKESTELIILLGKAKKELRNKIESDFKDGIPNADGASFDSYLAKQTEYVQSCLLYGQEEEKGIETLDREFKKFKTKEVAKKIATTAFFGLVIGASVQEGVALFKDDVQGIFEGMSGHNSGHAVTQTPLEHLRGWLTGHPSHMGLGNAVESHLNGNNFRLPEGSSIVQNSDGTYNILNGDQVVSNHIPLNIDANGNLDDASIAKLGEDGIVSTTTHTVIDGTKEVQSEASDYINNHSGSTHNVHRIGWYDNDTPKPIFDQNELKLHYGGIGGSGMDTNGNYVLDVSHMTSGGSFHEQFSVDAQDAIKNRAIKIVLSLTQGTQHHVFEVPIDANGNAIIDPKSEIGKLFFGTENGHAVFKGRFAEVVQSFGEKNGVEQIKSLATLVGPGNDSITDIIPTHIDTAVTALDLPLGTEPPYFIPIVSRKPLESLLYKDFNEKGPGYYGYGNESDSGYGLLDRAIYKERLCQELKDNSDYDLSKDDSKIIKEYLSKQDKAYLEELETLVSSSSKMSKSIETVITVPAYQEEKNIEKTIRNYAKLKNRNNFELVIFENHPSSKGRDKTGEIIERMKKEFPDMNIVHLYKAFDQKPTIGGVRKYLVDSVMLRKQNSGIDKSIAIVSNDADLEDISENYANDISSSFNNNKKLDAIGGKWDYPEKDFEKLPILHATQRLWHYFDIVFRNNYLKSPELIGRNSAFRSGIYAAIGGYNKAAKLAEDLEIGWMIKDARKYDSSRVSYLNKASLVSNSRRAVAKMLSGGHLIEQYGDFHENEDVRNKSLEELLKDKKDFDPEIFKKEIQSIYDHYSRWKVSNNGWIDDHFVDQTFDRAMRFTGVEYKRIGDSIKVLSIDKLLKGLSKENSVSSKKTTNEVAVESKKTKEIISSSEIKDIITAKIGNSAKIEKMDLNFTDNSLELNGELDAGILGGKIKIKGLIENSGDTLKINDNLKVEARGYVKSRIENNISNLAPEIKKYFEDKYNQSIKSINIEKGQIVLNF